MKNKFEIGDLVSHVVDPESIGVILHFSISRPYPGLYTILWLKPVKEYSKVYNHPGLNLKII